MSGMPWWWLRCHTCGHWIAWDDWDVRLDDARDYCPKHSHLRTPALAGTEGRD